MTKWIWFREMCGVVLAVSLLATASVHAQSDAITGKITDDQGKVIHGEVIILSGPDGSVTLSEHRWLGISLEPVPDVLRHHLKIKGGVVVGKVMPDSPAEKAKLLHFDIITQCAEKVIQNPSELVAKVAESTDKVLLLKILREGKPIEISITPMAAPERFKLNAKSITLKGITFGGLNGSSALSGDVKIDLPSGQLSKGDSKESVLGTILDLAHDPSHLRVFGPGLAFDVKTTKALAMPSDLSVSITKSGDKPANVVVKRGDESWAATEDKLDKLPKDVRPHVERLLGRHGINFSAAMPHAANVKTLRARIAPAIAIAKKHTKQGLATAREHSGDVQKVLDQVLSEIEELRLEIRQLRESKESDEP